MDNETRQAFADLNARFDALEERMDARFDRIERDLGLIKGTLELSVHALNNMSSQLDNHSGRIAAIEKAA